MSHLVKVEVCSPLTVSKPNLHSSGALLSHLRNLWFPGWPKHRSPWGPLQQLPCKRGHPGNAQGSNLQIGHPGNDQNSRQCYNSVRLQLYKATTLHQYKSTMLGYNSIRPQLYTNATLQCYNSTRIMILISALAIAMTTIMTQTTFLHHYNSTSLHIKT